MSAAHNVAPQTAVAIHYKLQLDDGTEVGTSRGGDPVWYLHGFQNIVPGLEEKLAGHTVGDHLEVEVPPEKGYGPRDPQGVRTVDRGNFPQDVEPQPGMRFQAVDGSGQAVEFQVTDVEDQQVTIDTNHPLAGHKLHFEVEVVAVRAATAEELEHGHVHGEPGSPH